MTRRAHPLPRSRHCPRRELGRPWQGWFARGRTTDYGPFIAEGIPAGGLFAGAEVPKTAAQVEQYGGIANAQFDPCYHEACDTFAGTGDGTGATAPGLGLVALDQMSDAAAHTVLFFSKTKVDVRNTPN